MRGLSSGGVDLARRRQLLVFDRFLARIAVVLGAAATLKGGLALEIRLERARTTKDVDLRMSGAADEVSARLKDAARLDLADFMQFEVGVDEDHPEIRNDGMPYDGIRFRAECNLAGKIYGRRFGVDVAFGDPILGEPDVVSAEDVLGFAGIAPPKLRLYPVESHVAEKLHAYTLPRKRPNSRIKDLPDIALLATVKPLEGTRLREALDRTFQYRKTHDVPKWLPAPPESWVKPYASMARDDLLPWTTLAEALAAASAFLNPVLAAMTIDAWDPATWAWSRNPVLPPSHGSADAP